jgi:hypothetical protein
MQEGSSRVGRTRRDLVDADMGDSPPLEVAGRDKACRHAGSRAMTPYRVRRMRQPPFASTELGAALNLRKEEIKYYF